MKSHRKFRRLALLFVAVAGVSAAANSEPVTTTARPEATLGKVEKTAYLGVETGPVPRALAAHLGLERDFGLVVNAVAEGSPAATSLREDDVLTKLDEQLLIDPRQLAVLILARRPGDEVKLSLIRSGREQVVVLKLGRRELPRLPAWRRRGGPDDGSPPPRWFEFGERAAPALERLREIPGLAREEVDELMRGLRREGGARVHVWSWRGEGSDLLDLRSGKVTYADDAGSIEIDASGAERRLKVQDPNGKVVFEGLVETREQREALPTEVKDRLKRLREITLGSPPREASSAEDGSIPDKAGSPPTSRTNAAIGAQPT